MLGRCVEFMAGRLRVARRRAPAIDGVSADDMPNHLKVFDPDQWAGNNPFECEQAWKTARADWVEKYKPIGLDKMLEDGLKPAEPFNPYGPNGESFWSFGKCSHVAFR